MAVIFPLICYALIAFTFHSQRHREAASSSLRPALLSAAVVWGVLVSGITEFLSFLDLITFGWTIGLWITACAASAVALQFVRSKGSAVRIEFPKVAAPDAVLLLGIALIVCVLGLIAVAAPPNSWDSMTYHMSRVAHWVQDHTVKFYPTHIARQNYSNPWAEFAILQLQVLSGGDRFANLIQWFSMIGCVVAASLIAKQLGADLRGQVYAAVIAVSIPLVVLQSTSTHNDIVVSFWLVCFVHYSLRVIVQGEAQAADLCLAGSSLGLAILTKPTTFILAAPILLWLVFVGIRAYRWRAWKPLLVAAGIAVGINAGHSWRNFDLFGNILGPRSSGDTIAVTKTFSNEILTAPAIASNVVRDISLHLATPFFRVNQIIEHGVREIHAFLGIDESDRRTTWRKFEFSVPQATNDEHIAGNLLHLALIGMTLGVLLMSSHARRSPILVCYAACLIVAYFLLTGYLKWSYSNPRLQLPLFFLAAPCVAIVLFGHSNKRVATAVAAVLLLSAMPYVLYNRTRPLIGDSSIARRAFFTNAGIFTASRADQYFSRHPEILKPYVGAANAVKAHDCADIGLVLRNTAWEMIDDWEYPLWVLLQADVSRAYRLQHVLVENVSSRKSASHPFNSFRPCAVIAVGSRANVDHDGITYAKVWSLDDVSVFLERRSPELPGSTDWCPQRGGVGHELSRGCGPTRLGTYDPDALPE